jgi:hypothetical protein
MAKSLDRLLQERLERQYQQHPTLRALNPQKEQNQAFKNFYDSAKGLPFFCWHLTTEEHQALVQSYYNGTIDRPCCFNHLIGMPLLENRESNILYHYQAYVGHKCGIDVHNQNLISSFADKFKIYELDSDIHDNTNRNIAIAKASNLGITELMLRIMLYKCVVNNDLSGSTMAILVGPSYLLALNILNRIREMLGRRLGLVFDTAQDRIVLNNVTIVGKPSHHIDTLRSITNMSFILLSEAAFFPQSESENILSTIFRFRSKGNPVICLESSANTPGDLLDRVFNYPDSAEYQAFTKIKLPYQVGIGTHYRDDLIQQQMKLPGFSREYEVQWVGQVSNFLAPETVDKAINIDYDLDGIPQAPKILGIDPNTGGKGSAFAFVVLQASYNKLQVLRAEQHFAPIDMSKMVDHALNLMRHYQNVRNVFCDAAVPIVWQSIARLLGQRTDVEQAIKEYKNWRMDDAAIFRKLKVQNVLFGQRGRSLMAALKWFMDTNTIQIHPSFKELIIGLKSIQAIEYEYLKDSSVHADVIDALRLALMGFRTKQPLPEYYPELQRQQ